MSNDVFNVSLNVSLMV